MLETDNGAVIKDQRVIFEVISKSGAKSFV